MPHNTQRTHDITLFEIVWKSAVVQTATYSVMGVIAFYAFNYTQAFESGTLARFMRPTSDPIITFGPLVQPLRGALFGIVFYLLRDALFARRRGWLVMWVMLGIVGILNTFAAATGSIEGVIYTQLSLAEHFGLGQIEVYGQALLLSLGVYWWVRRPGNLWLAIGLWAVALLFVAATIAGLVLPQAQATP